MFFVLCIQIGQLNSRIIRMSETANSNFPLLKLTTFPRLLSGRFDLVFQRFSNIAGKLGMTFAIRIFKNFNLTQNHVFLHTAHGQISKNDGLAHTPRTQDRCPHRVLPSVSESPEFRVLLKVQCQWSFTEVCSRLKLIYTPKFTTM